jgi:uncharacterized membrane protein
MPERWERKLERWIAAGLIETTAAERILAYEAEQAKTGRWRWPVLIAISLGGLLVGTGVLLFVAAHWDKLSPLSRFVSVLLMVGLFHVTGGLTAEHFIPLASTLHAVGTVCLGAGIFLAGQIFNLQEHWPTGVLLWASGAWVTWAFLLDWPQGALVALLTPLWLSSEWLEATKGFDGGAIIMAAGLLLLSVSYFTALLPEKGSTPRKMLVWIGGLALIPATLGVCISGTISRSQQPLPVGYHIVGWTIALSLPLALAWLLRHRSAWINLIAALWVVILSAASQGAQGYAWNELWIYGLCALGSIGLIAWGLQETRRERINLGLASFGLTVLFFYFSTVMDKLDRAVSLVGLGGLFLLGGWSLEKVRRRLLVRMKKGET